MLLVTVVVHIFPAMKNPALKSDAPAARPILNVHFVPACSKASSQKPTLQKHGSTPSARIKNIRLGRIWRAKFLRPEQEG